MIERQKYKYTSLLNALIYFCFIDSHFLKYKYSPQLLSGLMTNPSVMLAGLLDDSLGL